MEQQSAAAALEKHYRVQDVMEMWHFSHAVVTREFADEPGVIRLSNPGIGTRQYVTLSIPNQLSFVSTYVSLSRRSSRVLRLEIHFE